jgi:hypothetical protein
MVGAPPVVMLMTCVRALLDDLEEGRESLGRLVRLARLRVAGMKVDDRRAGLCRADCRVRDLLRRDREVGRHRRGVDRSGDGAGDDDFAAGHGASSSRQLKLAVFACGP